MEPILSDDDREPQPKIRRSTYRQDYMAAKANQAQGRRELDAIQGLSWN